MIEFSKEHTQRGIRAIQILMDSEVLAEENQKVIVGVIRAIMMLRLHKEEFGTDLFPKVMDKLIDHVATGLTKYKF